MKRPVAGLVIALVVAGFWAVVGSDGLANAQSGCASEGAVSAGETALAADCEVLLDVRDTLAGTATLNWAAETPIEDWGGIAVGGTPLRVVEVWLSDRGMTGTVPAELGDLSGLERLWLWNNQLTGTIPTELGNLSNLTELWLWGNHLTGTIPTELGNLSNLTSLHLGNNQLEGRIPTQLGNLSNLTSLRLGNNQLEGRIPTQLGNLENLTVLNLGNNQLTGSIPTELGDLENLIGLYLGNNKLVGMIPTELGDLVNLTELSLTKNQLSGTIPTELGDLSNLTFMSLSSNRLSGEVPTELGGLTNLTGLWLWGNQLTGEIPDSLTGLTSLENFAFFSNSGLCAPIDNAFQTWLEGIGSVDGSSCAPQDSQEDRAVLAELYSATDGANWEDSSNWLSDRPVREWYGVTNDANGRVIGLYLWENQLAGSIPPELAGLSNLMYLNLSRNQLSGTIPPELGNLSNLTVLFLRNNQLTGCIPAALQDVEFNDFEQVGLPFCGVPTVAVSPESESYRVRINSPIPMTATFSEPVNGFTVSDVTVVNGDVSSFSGSDGDSVFTFDVTPNAIGVVTVDIAAGVAQDSDSDGNAAAEQLTLGLPYDDDHDGAISATEVLMAVADYFNDRLSAQHVLQVVALYFASSN